MLKKFFCAYVYVVIFFAGLCSRDRGRKGMNSKALAILLWPAVHLSSFFMAGELGLINSGIAGQHEIRGR